MIDFLSTCFDQAPAAMVITDEGGRIVAANQAFSLLSGYAAERLVGATPDLLRSGRHDEQFFQSLREELGSAGRWSGEIWNRHRRGRVFATEVTIAAVRDAEEKLTNYIAVMSDITARKREEERERRAVESDPLTGLPNQSLFLDRLGRVCSRWRRHGTEAAIVFIDVDRFRAINGGLGFEAGDELLRQMARRVTTTVRESDTVARFGDDVFAIILPDLAHQRDVALVAKKLLSRLSDTYKVGHQQRAFVSVSLGLALMPTDGSEVGELVKCAEMALRQAKAAGRNLYRFYTEQMNAEALQRLDLERDLYRAVQEHQFELLFHPIIRSTDGALAGAEALIRWHRPGHGIMAPLDFLPLAEETGLIVPTGDWVLQEAVDALIACKMAGMPPLRMSVNISPRQLRDSEIFERVRQRLQAADIPAACIELEISESALQDIGQTEESVLQKVASFGIDLSIDDYGTGYTSLKQFGRLPIKTLKLDKIFLRNLGADPADTILIDAILAMARSLGIRSVAEGVETADEWRFMQERACDFGQGYLFSRPLGKDEFIAFAMSYHAKPSLLVQKG